MTSPITIKELDEKMEKEKGVWASDRLVTLQDWKADIIARHEKINDIIDELYAEGFYQYLWTEYQGCELTENTFNAVVRDFENKKKELKKTLGDFRV